MKQGRLGLIALALPTSSLPPPRPIPRHELVRRLQVIAPTAPILCHRAGGSGRLEAAEQEFAGLSRSERTATTRQAHGRLDDVAEQVLDDAADFDAFGVDWDARGCHGDARLPLPHGEGGSGDWTDRLRDIQ